MQYARLLLVAGAAFSVAAGEMLTVRRSSGGGIHFGARDGHGEGHGDDQNSYVNVGAGEDGGEWGEEDIGATYMSIYKRVTCGSGIGPCPESQCCSEAGYCGTSTDYCKGPQCQIDYSNGNCDASTRPCGESTIGVIRSTVGDVPYDTYIYDCRRNGTVALTFDDGPYLYTSTVLDILKQHDAKATFFITGNNLGKGAIDDASTQWPALLRRMHAEGHQLASHTWTHQNLDAVPSDLREQQVVYNEMAFRNIFGFFPRYLRPPYGACTRDTGCFDAVQRLGYHLVKWSFDTKDFEHNTAETVQLAKDIFDEGVPAAGGLGYVPLVHDIQYQTANNLTEFMLRNLEDKGYAAVTLGDCLGDAPENWYIDAGAGDGNDVGYADCVPDTS